MLEYRPAVQQADSIKNGRFEIQQQPATSVLEISGLPGCEEDLAAFVQSTSLATGHLMPVASLRWWLVGADDPELLPNNLAVTDISHAIAVFRLSGSRVHDVLRKGLAIDLAAELFPVGRSATSAIDGITVTIHRTDAHLDLYCRRSYAASLWHFLTRAGLEFL